MGNFNILSYSKDQDGKSAEPTKLIDGKYGVGPSNTDDNMNGRLKDAYDYHTADGVEDYHGDYLWGITFELDRAYMIDGVSIMTLDLTDCGIGCYLDRSEKEKEMISKHPPGRTFLLTKSYK